MRAASAFARVRRVTAACFGTKPPSARVSVAASSTSSHLAYLLASLQTRPISGRVYREIKPAPFRELRETREFLGPSYRMRPVCFEFATVRVMSRGSLSLGRGREAPG